MVKMIAYPVMVLSVAGVLVCFTFYFLGLTGVYLFPSKGTLVLSAGIFVVWFPTVILRFCEECGAAVAADSDISGKI